MNMLPDDTINIICLQLPIPIVANLIKSCQQFHSYLNAVFWKRYILRNHKDYRLCDDNIIFEQLIYIFRMSRLTNAIFHDFQYPEFGQPCRRNKKLSITLGFKLSNNIQIGDVCRFNAKENKQRKFIYNGNFLQPFDKDFCYNMPNGIRIIDQFPIDYWNELNVVFYFDSTPYLDQIKNNLVRVDKLEKVHEENKDPAQPQEIIYETWFIHKYGKKYSIHFVVDISPFDYFSSKYQKPDVIMEIISSGKFFVKIQPDMEPQLYINLNKMYSLF